MNLKIALLVAGILMCPRVGFSQSLSVFLDKDDTLSAIKLLKGGADINALDANGNSPLMNACRWAKTEIVGFILRHGGNANSPVTAKGRSPLMIACAYYSGKSICSLLIDHGANVNAVAKDGTTALMLAARNAKLDVVELLLKKGANGAAKNAMGKNALDFANEAEVDDFLKQSVKDTRVDKQAVIDLLRKKVK